MKTSKVQTLCKIAILAAIAAVVMLFDFSLPIVPPFYKLDFSEVIVLLGGFSLGVLPAIAIEALKIVLNLLLNGTTTLGIGELANFVMGCSFILPATLFYHRFKTKKHAAMGLGISIISLCVVASITNYFVLLPIYAYFFKMPLDALINMGTAINPSINGIATFIAFGVIPFNILKGTLSALIVLIVYKRVSPILKK